MQRFRIFNVLAAGLAATVFALPQLAAAQNAASSQTSVEQGKALAFSRTKGNCLACHTMKGGALAGNIGPGLSGMKARFPDRKTLFNHIWDEAKYNPMTVMPPFGRNKILSKQEIQKVVDFLYTL
ncbi:MAG TPA: sulfur oxidation c-type cytochrome SoxX [Burkholderiales bacterium]|nr:sulfur oxidation c-type cytochrome SoxX [Burkholderiales bacterium]